MNIITVIIYHDYIDINADYKNSLENKILFKWITMIKYNLTCKNLAQFESWFSVFLLAFERLKK